VHHKTHDPYITISLRPREGFVGWGDLPVARVSFLHHAYHVAHSFSAIERCALVSEMVSYIAVNEVEVTTCVKLFLSWVFVLTRGRAHFEKSPTKNTTDMNQRMNRLLGFVLRDESSRRVKSGWKNENDPRIREEREGGREWIIRWSRPFKVKKIQSNIKTSLGVKGKEAHTPNATQIITFPLHNYLIQIPKQVVSTDKPEFGWPFTSISFGDLGIWSEH